MAMTQTDKDIHEMARRITDISNSIKTLNNLVAKLVTSIEVIGQNICNKTTEANETIQDNTKEIM